MIVIDPATLSAALRDLHERTLVNLITGKVNWPEIVQAINDAGINDPAIAKRVGVSRATVNRWHKKGSPPEQFDVACRLIVLYNEAERDT